MSLWDDIGKAKTSEGGVYFEPGDYLCVVEKLVYKNGYKGESIIAEHEVIESKQTEHDAKPAMPGAHRNIVRNMSNLKSRDMARSEIKSYVLALFGMTPDQVTDEEFAATCKDLFEGPAVKTQPMRGKLIRIVATTQTNDKDGKKYVNRRYYPVEQTPESMAEYRAKLDGKK